MTARNLAALAAERAILARAAADVAAADAAVQTCLCRVELCCSIWSTTPRRYHLPAELVAERNTFNFESASLSATNPRRTIGLLIYSEILRVGLILLLVRRMLRLPQAEAGSRFARRRSGSQQLFLARSP